MKFLWVGFFLGCAFGVAARLGRFCLLRGLREYGLQPQAPALRAFALALAVALLASQALAWAGLVQLDSAPLLRARFSLPGIFLGGLLFGIGMALARSCGARALVLLAGGNLRALVTLLCLGLAAQASLTGVLAPARQWLQSWGMVQLDHAALPQWLAAQGWPTGAATLGAAALPALALLAYALRPARGGHRGHGLALLCAGVLGALVALGWWVATELALDSFDPVPLASLSFIGPVAEGLLYLQLSAGRNATLGPVIAAGVLAGAGAAAWLSGSARWEGFDRPAQSLGSACGGLLMGFGGVLAVGCSIGQGLTGLSTLAFASLPACLGIVAGALLTISLLNRSTPPQGDGFATT